MNSFRWFYVPLIPLLAFALVAAPRPHREK